jgi:tetratricopeptide (TPR) repeat protein
MYHLAGQFDPAADAAQEALALDPNFMMAHYRLGEARLEQGRVAEAIPALEKARDSRMVPTSWRSWLAPMRAPAGARRRRPR